jgi:hypothetical protein
MKRMAKKKAKKSAKKPTKKKKAPRPDVNQIAARIVEKTTAN